MAVELLTRRSGRLIEVAPDVACLPIRIVNCYLVGHPGSAEWVLVDAGMGPTAAARIREATQKRFGEARPLCIVLTHGHFDHLGGLPELAEEWEVPVLAHHLEIPYLTGLSSYPPPDPVVGRGAMSRLSVLFPRGPFDLGDRVAPLPADGSVPGLVGWRWIHTPGHTHGHVSLFRDADGTLIAGDAVVTTRQESALWAVTKRPELNGPPRYFTSDWGAAEESVRRLAALRPSVLATGHGLPMRGPELLRELDSLAEGFAARAVPRRGRYVKRPAVADVNGVIDVPKPVLDPLVTTLAGLALGSLAGYWLARQLEPR